MFFYVDVQGVWVVIMFTTYSNHFLSVHPLAEKVIFIFVRVGWLCEYKYDHCS